MNSDDSHDDHKLTRREREKLAHRQEIMDAAVKVFAEKGFHNATLDEVAQEAEFSKGALYLHFSSKEDLLYSIIRERFNDFISNITQLLDSEETFKEELRAMYKKFAELAMKNRDFFLIHMAHRAGKYHTFSEENKEEIKQCHSEVDGMFIKRIAKAQANGELRDINPCSIYGLIHGASESMMMTQWGYETLEELLQAVDVFIDMLFNGIAKEVAK